MTLKYVGKNGQISIGKAKTGMCFDMQLLENGDILLKQISIPENERWLHEPNMRKRIARSDAWMKKNPVNN